MLAIHFIWFVLLNHSFRQLNWVGYWFHQWLMNDSIGMIDEKKTNGRCAPLNYWWNWWMKNEASISINKWSGLLAARQFLNAWLHLYLFLFHSIGWINEENNGRAINPLTINWNEFINPFKFIACGTWIDCLAPLIISFELKFKLKLINWLVSNHSLKQKLNPFN